MIIALVVAWVLVGVISVPLLVADQNRRGSGMVRDAALETLIGVLFGPIPLAMFGGYFILTGIGKAVWWVTRQTGLDR